jgi:hypothetical protein
VVTNSRVHAIKFLLKKSSIKFVRKKNKILWDLSRLIKQGNRRIVLIVFVRILLFFIIEREEKPGRSVSRGRVESHATLRPTNNITLSIILRTLAVGCCTHRSVFNFIFLRFYLSQSACPCTDRNFVHFRQCVFRSVKKKLKLIPGYIHCRAWEFGCKYSNFVPVEENYIPRIR